MVARVGTTVWGEDLILFDETGGVKICVVVEATAMQLQTKEGW